MDLVRTGDHGEGLTPMKTGLSTWHEGEFWSWCVLGTWAERWAEQGIEQFTGSLPSQPKDRLIGEAGKGPEEAAIN